jgi:hypothetical protein
VVKATVLCEFPETFLNFYRKVVENSD